MPNAGRRDYDREIDPVIENYVERRLVDTRHEMRTEFTAALVSSTNQINASIQEFVTEMRDMGSRTLALEKTEAVDHGVAQFQKDMLRKLDSNRRWLVGTAIAVIGAFAAIVSTLPH